MRFFKSPYSIREGVMVPALHVFWMRDRVEIQSQKLMKPGPCPFEKDPDSPARQAQFHVLLCCRVLYLLSGCPDRYKVTQTAPFSISKREHEDQYYPLGKQSSKIKQKPTFKPHYPVIPLLGICPKERKLNTGKKFYTQRLLCDVTYNSRRL